MAKKNTESEEKIVNIADKLPEENATPKAKRTRKKKVTPAEVAETNHGVELSEFEQSIISADEKKIEYVLEPRTRGGTDIHVEVAQSIPVAYLMQLMRDVIHVYFPDGGYDPFFGHNVIEMVLFEAYTRLTFHDDVDVYNKFKSLYCYWPSGIELDVTSILPVEALGRVANEIFKKIPSVALLANNSPEGLFTTVYQGLDKDGNYSFAIYFKDKAVHRDSLWPEGYPEGLDNVY